MQLLVRLKRYKRIPWVTAGLVVVFLSVTMSQNWVQIHRLNLFARSTTNLTVPRIESRLEEEKEESLSPVVQLLQRSTSYSRLPSWYHEYLDWHRSTLEQLNETNWSNHQYVLLRCVRGDDKCYGTSDRLKMVPVMILMAAQTNRLFFIYWSRPARLEEFLLPNQVNWTLPDWLHPLLDAEAVDPLWCMGLPGSIGMYNDSDQTVLRIKSMVYAHTFYDEQRYTEDEPRLWDIYHEFWNALFLPSPPIQARIEAALRELNLFEDSSSAGIRPYVSVHVRSQYVKNMSDSKEEENAIRCASHLQRELASSALFLLLDPEEVNVTQIPIYVASDTAIVTQHAVDYGRAHNLLVLGRPQSAEDPWHLDRREGMPAQFYDTFVDLYLLAFGECYTWGRGGYGSWAAALGNSAHFTCPSSRTHFGIECEFASVGAAS
jgi:hypothetical protein